jgi:hypothetical protein
MQPSKQSLYSPTLAIAPQRTTTVLRLLPAFSSMRCNHFDSATVGQVTIQAIAVVGFVADQSRREEKNQKLQLHPHVHCVVPAGGLSRDHARWIRSHPRFFLPIAVLRRVFRGKFVAALRSAFQRGQLHLAGELAPLTHPKFFAAWLRPLFRKDWIVYSKPPFGGPEYVLQYLGRYTHRVAISNHRLVSFDDGQVTFRWRDSADHNRQKLMTLLRDEFLRRFLLHLLPKGFVRIRHFGFLANRRRAALLPRCFAALHATPPKNESETSNATAHPLWRCPKCGGPMAVVERFTAEHLQLRSPPLLATAA